MIRRSSLFALMFLGLSASVHAMVIGFIKQDQPIEMAGGAASSVARLGNSFEDIAAGVLTGETGVEILPETPVELEPDPPLPVVDSVDVASVATTIEAVVPETALVPLALEPVAPAALQTLAPTAIVTPEQTTPDLIQALPAVAPVVVQLSPRPKVRPKTIEAKAPKPKQQTAKTKPRTTTHVKPKPQPNGASKVAATRGSEQGQEQTAAKEAASRNSKANRAGNAAVSNYQGQVMRKLSRQRKPRVGSKGTALIEFSIAGDGRLAKVKLARSSGSTELDSAALSLVRRAGPFPAPPPNARRNYQISIKGR